MSPSSRPRLAARGFDPALWLSIPVLLFLLLPTLVVIPLSFSGVPSLRFPPPSWSGQWYAGLWTSADWQGAALRSAAAGACAAAIATPAGIAVALVMRSVSKAWRDAIRVGVMLPLFVPGILIGVGVLFLYSRLGLNNTFVGLVLAHATLALPFVAVTMEAGLSRLDPSLFLAARSLGASYLGALMSVVLPVTRGSVIAAALFAFLTSFDEIAVAFFISSGDASTLPRRMFGGLRDSFDPTIAAISTLLVFLTTTIIAFAMTLEGRRAR
jgi:putative spermidine/putrescine transport system permease protein